MRNNKTQNFLAVYFIKEKTILEKFFPKKIGVMQFFQREDFAILCGIPEVLELLKNNTKHKYTVSSLSEGSEISANEVVLEITGYVSDIYPLEGIIDSILARRTSVATNAHLLKKAANGKQVIMMSDRSDLFINQKGDGYAAHIGGVSIQVTKEQVSGWATTIDEKPVGTIPHSLIQACKGDLVEALKYFQNCYPEENLIGLVDFNNDVINDSLKIAEEFKDKLFGVRVDTSHSLIDKSLEKSNLPKDKICGVNPTLIKLLRKKLDENNFSHVKIIVSSGFNVEKISYFEQENTPIDFYGVGEYFTRISRNFTGDAVQIENLKLAKVGRAKKENKRLTKII